MKTRLVSIAIVALFLLSAGLTVQAGPGSRGAGAAGADQANCVRGNQLGLDKDQMIKIRDIVKQFHSDVRGVVESTATREEKKAKVEELKSKAGDAILAVLTPEQQTKAKQSGWIERVLSARRQGMHELGDILRQLNLTTEQKASVKAILEDSRTQGKAIKDDTSLTKEQKVAKFLELRKATIEKIAGVLTPEQQAKFRELLAKLPQPGARGRGSRH